MTRKADRVGWVVLAGRVRKKSPHVAWIEPPKFFGALRMQLKHYPLAKAAMSLAVS